MEVDPPQFLLQAKRDAKGILFFDGPAQLADQPNRKRQQAGDEEAES